MKRYIHFNKLSVLIFIILFSHVGVYAQFRIQLRMTTWCITGNHDCDNAGQSDFKYEMEGFDHSNNLGLGGWDNCGNEITGNDAPGCNNGGQCFDIALDDRLWLEWRFRIFENDAVGVDAEWATYWNTNQCFIPNLTLSTGVWRTLGTYSATINDADCNNAPDVPYTATIDWKITGSSAAPANDLACQATSIGTGGTFDFCETYTTNSNNVNAMTEDMCFGNNEPQETSGRTVWYKFTTGAAIGNNCKIRVQNGGGGNAMTPDLVVYRLTGAAPGCSNPNFSGLQFLGHNSGNFPVDDDAEINLTTCASGLNYYANTTYYIQIEDENNVNGPGNFTLTVTDNGYQSAQDNICNATNMGTFNSTVPACGPKYSRSGADGILDRGEIFTINRESNRCATTQGGEPNSPDKTVWYKFTTGTVVGNNCTITINAINDLDAIVTLYQTCTTSCPTFGQLTEIDRDNPLNTDNSPHDASITFKPVPGATYYIQVDGANTLGNGNVGDYNITVNMQNSAALPTNDYIVNAIQITTPTLDFCDNITTNGNNIGATDEDFCFAEPQETEGKTVWYKFTTGATIGNNCKIRVNNAGGGNGMTPDVSVYGLIGAAPTTTNPNFGSLFFIDHDAGAFATKEYAEINLTSCSGVVNYYTNTTYYIQIENEGNANGDGNFTLIVTDNGYQSAQDNICNATDMGTFNGTVPACGPKYSRTDGSNVGILDRGDVFTINRESNRCATSQGGEPNSPDKTVWYEFTTGTVVGNSCTITVNAMNDLDAIVALYRTCETTGCPALGFNDLTEIDRDNTLNTDNSPHDASITFQPAPGATYYIQVDGANTLGNGNVGDYNITVNMPNSTALPTNDYIVNAIQLAAPTLDFCENIGPIAGNNIGATDEDFCFAEPQETEGKTVWYKFTTGANIGNNCKIRVDNAGNPNGMTPDVSVYRLTGTAPTTTNPNFGSLLFVARDAGAILTKEYAEINLSGCSPANYLASTTYYVQIENENNANGDGNFTISLIDNGYQSAQDNLCNATDMGTFSGTVPACAPKYSRTDGSTAGILDRGDVFTINRESNRCATTQSGEPNSPDKTVWYKFTTGTVVGNSCTITVNAMNDLDAIVALYRTCITTCPTFGQLTEIDRDNPLNTDNSPHDASITFQPAPGATYYIQVDGANTLGNGNIGDYNITVNMPNSTALPTNDYIVNAIQLAAPTLDFCENIGPIAGNNIGATDEDFCFAEPQETEGKTVWYKFTTGANIGNNCKIRVDNAGNPNGMTPDVSVYRLTGTAPTTTNPNFGSLLFVARDAGAILTKEYAEINLSGCSPANYLASTTYYVQIENENNANGDGNFTISLIDNGYQSAQDNLCNATDMGTFSGTVPACAPKYSRTDGSTAGILDKGDVFTINRESNRCATTQSGEPNSPDKTVWYKFTTGTVVGNSCTITVNAMNDLDAIVALYRTCITTCPTFGQLTEIDRDNPLNTDNNPHDASITFQPAPSATYYIQVDGANTLGNGNVGDYNITVNMPNSTALPTNDYIVNAIQLAAPTLDFCENIGPIAGNNIGATDEDFCFAEPQETVGKTVWYKFTTGPTIGNNCKIYVENGGSGNAMTPDVSVYKLTGPAPTLTNPNFGSLSFLDHNGGNFPVDDNAEINLTSCAGVYAPNTTYYVQIENENNVNGDGNFNISVTDNGFQDGPDGLCNAMDIGTFNGTVPACGPKYTRSGDGDALLEIGENFTINRESNRCATAQQPGEQNSPDKTNWYKFTTGIVIGNSCTITVDAINDLDAKVTLYIGCQTTCPALWFTELQEIAHDNPVNLGNGPQDASITFKPVPSVTYFIQVDGVNTLGNGRAGDYNLIVNMPNSTALPVNDYIVNAIQLAPPTLDFCESIGPIAGNNIDATDEDLCSINEPQETVGKTVWYKFTTGPTIGNNCKIYVENGGSGNAMTPDVSVYKLTGPAPTLTNPNFGSLSFLDHNGGNFPVDDNAEINITNCAGVYAPNTTYYIQIENENNVNGDGNFNISVTDNGFQNGPDDLCNAMDIGTFTGTVPACGPKYSRSGADGILGRGETFAINRESNRCASAQNPAEPNSPDKTTWYKFKTDLLVGDSCTITVDAINDLDAKVTLYIGCQTVCPALWFNELQEVANNNPVNLGGGAHDAAITFKPLPDLTYFIQVDGVNTLGSGNAGDYNLSVSMTNQNPLPSNDYICNATYVGISNFASTLNYGAMTNINYSDEDICLADEPNANANDETAWFKFCTNSTVGQNIRVDVDPVSGSGTGGACVSGGPLAGWVRTYKGPSTLACIPYMNGNIFSQLMEVGENADITTITQDARIIRCPDTNSCYYIQVETGGISCDMANFTMSIQHDNLPSTARLDYICQAASSNVPGVDGFMGTLNSSFDPRTSTGNPSVWDSTDYDLQLLNQTARCATENSAGSNANFGEPDETGALTDLNKTVWYRFRTPGPDYTSVNAGTNPLGQLAYTYKVTVERLSSSSSLVMPSVFVYQEANTSINRSCPNSSGDYDGLVLLDKDEFSGSKVQVKRLCLRPNTNYYIQVNSYGGIPFTDDKLDYNISIVKDQYRPADMVCDAVDLGYITANRQKNGVTTNVLWGTNSYFNTFKSFGLPHTNKCAGSENNEPRVTSVGGPGPTLPGSGNYTASVWYKFRTGSGIQSDWIYWFNDDKSTGGGNRGNLCVQPFGVGFNSRVTIYKSRGDTLCPVVEDLVEQEEQLIPGDVCDAGTGIGVSGAPCFSDRFRLKCPEPNTIYFVQVQDAGLATVCNEGQWEFDNSTHTITSAPALGGAPINDTICGAIDLGGNYISATLNYNINIGNGVNIFDNFCATPDGSWNADNNQPLERDVWFCFKPPASGSILVTAKSNPPGTPTNFDANIDIQLALWEPILGDGTKSHCSDQRFLWTPIVAKDHGIADAAEQVGGPSVGLPQDIYNTCGNGILCNEGNSFIATCLDPNKYYYLQVDGGVLPTCDAFNNGTCKEGYFSLQINDANLGLYDADFPSSVGTPFLSLGSVNSAFRHDEPCYAEDLSVAPIGTNYNSLPWKLMTNRCASSINDPQPDVWVQKNSGTDKTVWAKFLIPPSGRVLVRAENLKAPQYQIKGDPDYHQDINLQIALYEAPGNDCYLKSSFIEVGNGSGFDGAGAEIDPLNPTGDFTGICVPCVGACGYDEYYKAHCLTTTPGTYCYIMIDGDAGDGSGATSLCTNFEDIEGDFRISVEELAGVTASTNDDICMAYTMQPINNNIGSVYTSPILFTNECATIDQAYEATGTVADTIDGLVGKFKTEHTLWFKFTAPSTGKVQIKADVLPNYDKVDLGIAVFDIPSQNCADIQSAGYKFAEEYDPAVVGVGMDEKMTVSCLVPGRTYWVQVDGNTNASTCGPLLVGTDCKTGEFRMEITTLAPDLTYSSNVLYTTPPSTQRPGGNDLFCQAHNILNAGGTYNSNDPNTYLGLGETLSFTHNNRCATQEPNEPNVTLFGQSMPNPFDIETDPTVWYTFNTGPNVGNQGPGDITIRLTNPSSTPTLCFLPRTQLYEYSGTFTTSACNIQALTNSQFNNIIKIADGVVFNPLKPRESEIVLTCPKPNTTYFYRVYGTSNCGSLFSTEQGDFDISISESNSNNNFLVNNDICGATNVGSGNLPSGGTLSLTNQNNICATQQLNEPNTTPYALVTMDEYDETTWHKFTTSANPGSLEIVLRATQSEGGGNHSVPILHVYEYLPSGNPCSSTQFANLGDLAGDMGACNFLGNITVDSAKVYLPCSSPNTTYYIQVDGMDNHAVVTAQALDDNFYYNIIVRDLGNGISTIVNDNLSNAIPVDNVLPIDGNLAVGGTLTINGNNRCATCEVGEPGDYCGTSTTGHAAPSHAEDESVWYYFITPNTPGVISVTVSDNSSISGTFSPNFTLYYNNGAAPTYRITNAPAQNIVQEGTVQTASVFVVIGNYTCLLPNTKYYIRVDGNDNVANTIDQGDFVVTVTDDGSGAPGPRVPTNYDLICSANTLTIPANGTTGVLARTNKCAWEEEGEPNTSGNMGGTGMSVTSDDYDETVWFTFVPPADGDISMVLEPTSGINGGINYHLYEMPSTSTIACSGTSSDIPTWTQLTERASGVGGTLNTGGTSDQISATWNCLRGNRRYYIQVDGNDWPATGDVGNFNIQLSHASGSAPVNDMICGIGAFLGTGNFGVIPMGATTLTCLLQNNRCATQELNEPDVNGPYNNTLDPAYDHTLWYRFVASSSDGTYNISVINNPLTSDPINADIAVYQQTITPMCSGITPNFGNLSLIEQSTMITSNNNDETVSLECWQVIEDATYYIQVQGFDGILGGDVGNDFNVLVQFTPGSINNVDNICSALPMNLNGVNQSADNRCATTQLGEPNIEPIPQTPADGNLYDETLWYTFVAPPSGEVRLTTSSYSPNNLSLSADIFAVPVGYNCSTSGFTNVVREDFVPLLTSLNNTTNFTCLIPGRTYYLRFDGVDGASDKGTWNFNLTDLDNATSYPAVVNDEPCSAIDVTSAIRTEPCNSTTQYEVYDYSILDATVDIDRATRTPNAIGCNGEYNCNDYWFKFTVPTNAVGGIRVQGNDEYGFLSGNNSTQIIGIYRAVGGCSGTLQKINCGIGGNSSDVDISVATYAGETLYMQVYNADAPASPSYTDFGFCLSLDCPARTDCVPNSILYDQPLCWNMNTNEVPFSPQYPSCISDSIIAVNYASFTTDCDGTPVDTVSVVFSVSNLGCNNATTAMSLFADQSPCSLPYAYDNVVISCVVFEDVPGGSTALNYTSTFILPACSTYVIQIISNVNSASCGSGGQVVVVRSDEPPTSVLPVELTTFTGYNDDNVNVLNWTTASELNTLKFEVEKSADGTNFAYIGEKPAAGNSSIPLNYTLNDEHPLLGNNYYRLKMIDIDRQFTYSNVINIKVDNVLASTTDGIVKIYPNPTNGKLNVVYQATNTQKVNLDVFNVVGQSMFNNTYEFNAGMNTIVLDAANYAEGVYILNIQNTTNGNKYQSKFVKE